MHQSGVSMIIFLYIFIGAALLFFNIFYMFGSSIKKRSMELRIRQETEEQKKAIENVPESTDRHYQRRLYRKLKDEDELLIQVEALEKNLSRTSEENMTAYMTACRSAIFDAAEAYQKKPAMEKALFAYFVSLFPPKTAEEYRRLGEIFLSYLDHSTVYCRENVLQALYRLGNADALIRALQVFRQTAGFTSPN